MKKQSKFRILGYAFAALCVALVILFCTKYKSYLGKRPLDQPGTTWVSEDRSIVIHVGENHQGRGTIDLANGTIQFIYCDGLGVEIELYSIEAEGRLGLYPEERYESWRGNFARDDYFVATVQETTFFKVGEEIAFYRVDE